MNTSKEHVNAGLNKSKKKKKKSMTTWHSQQLNAIENLLWYLIVYIRVKTDMWHGFTKTVCKAM